MRKKNLDELAEWFAPINIDENCSFAKSRLQYTRQIQSCAAELPKWLTTTDALDLPVTKAHIMQEAATRNECRTSQLSYM